MTLAILLDEGHLASQTDSRYLSCLTVSSVPRYWCTSDLVKRGGYGSIFCNSLNRELPTWTGAYALVMKQALVRSKTSVSTA